MNPFAGTKAIRCGARRPCRAVEGRSNGAEPRGRGSLLPNRLSQRRKRSQIFHFPFSIFIFLKGIAAIRAGAAGELRRQWIFYPLKRARLVLYRAAPTVSLRKNPAHFKQSRRSCEVRAPSAQGIWKKIHWRPHKALIFI